MKPSSARPVWTRRRESVWFSMCFIHSAVCQHQGKGRSRSRSDLMLSRLVSRTLYCRKHWETFSFSCCCLKKYTLFPLMTWYHTWNIYTDAVTWTPASQFTVNHRGTLWRTHTKTGTTGRTSITHTTETIYTVSSHYYHNRDRLVQLFSTQYVTGGVFLL